MKKILCFLGIHLNSSVVKNGKTYVRVKMNNGNTRIFMSRYQISVCKDCKRFFSTSDSDLYLTPIDVTNGEKQNS